MASTSSAAATSNTVAFKRDGGKAVFVKAKVGTTKLLRVTVPGEAPEGVHEVGTSVVPTRFRVRILSKKFGKKFTKLTRSPLIAPKSAALPPGYVESLPDGDCDNDGQKNRADADDDNDSLTDTTEASLNLNPCKADTDADGVEDRFEFDCDRNGVLNRDEADDDKDLLTDGQEQAIGTEPCSLRLRRRRRPGRLRVPVRARPQRRRAPAAERLPAVPRQAAVPEPAVR